MPSLLAPPDEWVRQLDAEVQNARGGTMPFSKFRGLRDGASDAEAARIRAYLASDTRDE